MRRGQGYAHSTGLLVLSMLAALVAGSGRARAVYECGGERDDCPCGRANFCICCSDSTHGQNHGNCVWWAWEQACCHWGIALEWCTNANTWDDYARNNGYPVVSDPCPNTVFVCEVNTTECGSGDYGHVGWVLAVHPNGSIDVTEQGCYSWYGVKSRTFNAQNASPPMHYILEPGTTCNPCECNPGDQETADCPMCGQKTRTCGSDCQWGSWSACTGQGECEEGDTRPCGECGGTQTCDNTCHWGPCEEVCPDAAVWEDAAPPDAMRRDSEPATRPDASRTDAAVAADASARDATARQPISVRSGCGCTAANPPGGSLPLALVLLGLLLARRSRIRLPKGSPE